MATIATDETVGHAEEIANRYRVEKALGQGGMGAIYQVYDTSTDRRFALKQLSLGDDGEKKRHIQELFEREFHTLSHLSHPRVVEVYDYGRDGDVSYYTMELLDGGDLNQLSPLPWTEACALLCDICSALSLLHSRRLVHRDLTPRNIRCTQDRKAKLIDFGAMIPMGPCKRVVGTPPFVAPEAFNAQIVDARTDLFSLGATAYYALTGRHAYARARSFAGLRDAWRTPPLPPSRHVPEIPKELDDLVMSLVHLDIMARPTSAAEVMERLSAIAGLQIDERLVVRQAYLSTPTLVGRDEPLLRVRKQVVRALRNRGGVVMVTGASGVGRSRFLDACVLEGKLAGALVLRADATDANRGDWGAARALARQLVEVLPQAAMKAARPHVPVLGHILPELVHCLEASVQQGSGAVPAAGAEAGCETSPLVPDDIRAWSLQPREPSPILKSFDSPEQLRSRLQSAFRDWLLDLSTQRCLMVAADDVHRMDEPSAGLLALVSDQACKRRLVVAVTAETEAPATSERALSLLSEAGARIKLRNLSLENTQQLLCSVFGEVPNIRLLADRVYAISKGNPRAVMQLAQYVLDKGLVRYEAGAWFIPSSMLADELPHTLDEALKARLENLSSSALELARSMALCSKQSFSFDDCLNLGLHPNRGALLQDLDQLVALEMVSTDGKCYALSQAGWGPLLTDELDEEHARTLHLRLADLLQKCEGQELRVAHHLLQANESERALDVFDAHAHAVHERRTSDPAALPEYIRSLPDNWLDVCESLIGLCKQLGRPLKQLFVLERHLVSVDALQGQAARSHLDEVIQQLCRDSGLDLYEEQDDSLDASTRLSKALGLAQQRFDAIPESDRVQPPAEAIPQLARTIVEAIGAVGSTNDYAFFESLPSLEPLVSLSPALGVVEKNRQSTTHLNAGRVEQARQGWLEVIERMDQPDRAGLEGIVFAYMRLGAIYAVGTIDINAGVSSAVKWIDELEKNPLFEVNAWRLRMVFALHQGDFVGAEECKKRVELLQIQNSPTQFFEAGVWWIEAICYAVCDDLIRLKQVIPAFEKMAEQYPGWAPCLHYVRGQYQRIRGDWHKAIDEFDQALSLMTPGRHLCWLQIAGDFLYTLVEAGELARAKAAAQEALQVVKREKLGNLIRLVQGPLALVHAGLHEFDRAVQNAEAVIRNLTQLGTTGLLLGAAYETRARVAIMMKDAAGFQTYAQLCADQYRVGHNPALTAKYEKLMLEARRAKIRVASQANDTAELSDQGEQALQVVAGMLGSCQGPSQRAARVLDLIVQKGGFLGGLLYTIKQGGPVLAAQSGTARAPVDIDSLVADYLSAELDDAQEVTVTVADLADCPETEGAWTGPDGDRFLPLMLAHESDAGFAITGVAVLRVDPARELIVPYRLLPVLSRSLLDAGDVVTALAAC